MADNSKVPHKPDKNQPVDEVSEDAPHEFVSPRDEIAIEETEPEPVKAEVLAKPSADKEVPPKHSPHRRRVERFKEWYVANKKRSIPLSILGGLLLLLLIPMTRYPLAAAFGAKQDVTIQVLDSTTHTPVSGADVKLGSISATTDGAGKAILKNARVGNAKVAVSKKYYRDSSLTALVPLFKQKSAPSVDLVASGRPAKIKVTDFVSGKPLAGVSVQVLDIDSKTDKDGTALVVLPVGTPAQTGTLAADGYNKLGIKVEVSDQTVKENTYKLVPAGKIYFLSNRSGKVDVMKSNLDGGEAAVVLAGTGREEERNTILIASSDQKYVALLSRRTSDVEPHLYVIPTDTDKAVEVDSGSVEFDVEGWAGNYLIYSLTRKDYSYQPGKSKLKSYNAASGSLTILDQSAAVGDAGAYAYEYYTKVMVSGSSVVFAKNWAAYWQPSTGQPEINLSGKQNTLNLIGADGTKRSQVTAFDDQSILPSYTTYGPNKLYIWQRSGVDNTFLSYTVGGSPKSVSITPDRFYKGYPKYLSSPSGKQVLWNEQRDGKNVLLIGEPDGSNAKPVDSGGGDFAAYGWYTDNYLLVTKEGSELHIMSASGGTPVKITNYLQASGYYHQ